LGVLPRRASQIGLEVVVTTSYTRWYFVQNCHDLENPLLSHRFL